ncbi:ATP-dependent nuclease [Emticicia soli]|uniref:ATP-dependent endonuclease n=1 Tax=Emticicia soli TaxID=2027878 RepID=A0ABW5J520_9BACT
MKIEIKQKYKSLNPFISEELNGLTVITGKNGSGKSQLLELIGNINDVNRSTDSFIEISPQVRIIQTEGISKVDSKEITLDLWNQYLSRYIEKFRAIPSDYREIRRYILDNKLDFKRGMESVGLISDTEEYSSLIKNSTLLEVEQYGRRLDNNQKELRLLAMLFSDENKQFFKLLEEICKESGKSEKDIVEADFYNYPIREHLIDESSLFGSQIEVVFYNYAKRRDENSYRQFRKEKYNESNNSVSDEEFVQKYPVPWEMINKILGTQKIEFKFREIEASEFSKDVPFNIEILKNGIADSIKFSELSSGEKVIFGLILKLFTSRYYKEALKFPDLIVLDEPDAHLHPEMSKLLLDILEQTFVQKLGIKVIITTHSPSTVALAPEESLYELRNGTESSLKKISKDDALQLLTSFIPTLSIDYKNHRQVFVEGPNDILYYQGLYERHNREDKSAFKYKLYFISNANGQGNSTQVMNTVKAMQDANNKTCFGIVDWDKDNSDRGSNIFVHGFEKRYSVEQFVFDPIYIISLLMSNNNMQNILGEMGFQKTENPYFFKKSNDELQRIVDIFFEKFAKKYPKLKFDEKEEVEYLDGKRISLPIGFLKESGHDFVNKVFEFYPALKNKYKDQNGIQAELTNVMLRFYPFVPLSTIDLLKQIAN